ncbi:APC membrane recruitment protein 2 [Esox lucius]|uniref:APC membrane recruitment protein 2 n=1 Tax=Esox lucius TaxID=8010 RepID=UPI00147713AD|nr:APC membrane recruitment protein 2 [Esox lucius]
MDVQSESSEPPPCDPQPPGKIRKAFKLFGKRKPGSIFSVRGKGEGNNKSPIARSKTTDGLKESAEPETEKEQEPEVSQGKEEEEAVEEPLGDDGDPHVPSAGRPSISSMTSAKSLSFLMKLRRSRRGGPDRRFRTESQPKGRQRRGLKGLFGSMRWNQQEKGPSDDSETPPSPLLMASRTSSVEIIKEDMTLTPRPVPRSPDVPEPGQESPVSSTSPTVQGSSSSSRLETTAASVATDSVTGSTEDVPPPLPTTEPPPLDPPVDRLTSLLADISSLISFDSLTGCGDISAEVEAEWGKASTTVWAGPGTMGPVAGEKAPLTTFSARATPTTKPSPTPIPLLTSTFKPTNSSAPFTKPSSAFTSTIKPEPTPTTTTKPSTTPSTFTSSATKSSPSPLTKPSPLPTTESSPSPSPFGITSNSPPFTPSFTSTSTFKPTPVVTPSPAPISKPAPVVTPSPAPISKPSPVVTHSPAPISKPAPVVTPSPAHLSKPAPVVTPSPDTISKPAPGVTPSPSPACKPAPVVTPSPAPSSKPAPVSPPVPVTTPSSLSSVSATYFAPVAKPPLETSPVTFTSSPPPQTSSSVDSTSAPSSLTPLYPAAVPSSAFKIPYIPVPVPTSFTSSATVRTAAMIPAGPESPSAADSTPVHMSKAPPFPTPTTTTAVPKASPAPCLSSPILSPTQAKPGERKSSLTSPNGLDVRDTRNNSTKREEKCQRPQNETHKVPQGPPTEKKTPPLKAAGLSKIPVCGGGRSGKLPLRETQPTDEEGSWDPSTPGREEESPRPGLRHAGSKDTISNSSSVADGEAGPATVKHSPEESRQLRQPAVYGSGSRDSKIPVKLGAQSNIPVPHGAKEPPRSKIPLSKVPVRRIANKPTAPAAAGAQIRK